MYLVESAAFFFSHPVTTYMAQRFFNFVLVVFQDLIDLEGFFAGPAVDLDIASGCSKT